MTSQGPSFTEIDGVSIVLDALDYAAKKAGMKSSADAVASFADGDIETYLNFRYSLAKEAARQIAETCDDIEAALVFLENRCESFPGDPVLMGLLVSRKTAALQALVDSVGEAVRQEVAERVPALAGFETVLIIELIDKSEVSTHRGLGALVGSTSEAPTRVWP